MGVVGDHENVVGQNGHAAVESLGRVADQALGAGTLEVPDFTADTGIQCPAFVATGDIHDALDDHRRGLGTGGCAFHGEHPLGGEPGRVFLGDLGEGAVAVSTDVAVVRGPVGLGCDFAVGLAVAARVGPQQVDFGVVRLQLDAAHVFVEDKAGQRGAGRGPDGLADRGGAASGAKGAEKRDHAGLFGHCQIGETGHAAILAAIADDGIQLFIGQVRHAVHDVGAHLAAHGIAAVAGAAVALVLQLAGLRLRSGLGLGGQIGLQNPNCGENEGEGDPEGHCCRSLAQQVYCLPDAPVNLGRELRCSRQE